MNLKDDLPKPWILIKAILFLVILALCTFIILTTNDLFAETVAVAILMWSSARLYYFCFYVIHTYLDPTFKFTGIVSALRWIFTKPRQRPKSQI